MILGLGRITISGERLDFSAPDIADDIKLNEIVWRSVSATFYKAHAKDDEDDK
jgi:hypothetical protein